MIQYDWCPREKRRHRDRHTHTGKYVETQTHRRKTARVMIGAKI